MAEPLVGAFAKIERAEKHLRCLNEQIDGWAKESRPTPTGAQEPQVHPTVFRSYIEFDPIPDIRGWALLVGDTVHNLRSALDHVIYECSGPNPPVGVEWPAIRDMSYMVLPESDRRSYGYKIRGIRHDVVRTIIYRAQPWRRKDAPHLHPLWVLQQLDIQDKHRLLTPVAGVPRDLALKVKVNFFDVGDHSVQAHGPEWVPFDRKTEFLTLETDVPPDTVDMDFSFQFILSLLVSGTVLPLQSTLNKLKDYARGLVEQVRDALIEAEAPPA